MVGTELRVQGTSINASTLQSHAQAFIDKVVGTVMLLASLVIFAFYTTWVVITVRAVTLRKAHHPTHNTSLPATAFPRR